MEGLPLSYTASGCFVTLTKKGMSLVKWLPGKTVATPSKLHGAHSYQIK